MKIKRSYAKYQKDILGFLAKTWKHYLIHNKHLVTTHKHPSTEVTRNHNEYKANEPLTSF